LNNKYLTIRFESFRNGKSIDFTVAELGTLLVAINRSVNALIADSGEVKQKQKQKPTTYTRATIFQEPDLVQLVVHSTRSGSFELQAVIDLLNAVGLDHENAKNLLLNIIATAMCNELGAKKIAADFKRAIRRISSTAREKTIYLVIRIGDKVKRIKAYVHKDGKVDVNIEEDESDDESKPKT